MGRKCTKRGRGGAGEGVLRGGRYVGGGRSEVVVAPSKDGCQECGNCVCLF